MKFAEDTFFDFLIALHSMNKMGAEIKGFYGRPIKNNKYELILVLQRR